MNIFNHKLICITYFLYLYRFQNFSNIIIYLLFLSPQRFEEQYDLCWCRNKGAFIHFSDIPKKRNYKQEISQEIHG